MPSMKERYERLSARMKGISAKAGEAAMQLRTDMEVIGAAALLGAIRGDYEGNGKTFEIGGDAAKGTSGIAPELVVGAPLKLIGFYLGKKDGGSDVNAIADGALAAWGYQFAHKAMYDRAAGTAKKSTAGPRAPGRLEAMRERMAAAEQRRQAAVPR